ncbi:MAG: phospho-N-acetylmuramoyl-pentapeptide-transferase [Erysipelotrichaceae bacterium]|nr:phospho-N-acetylmuramoyl-pentapeptide-transferase [Erysipelotrichaceae bacterium]
MPLKLILNFVISLVIVLVTMPPFIKFLKKLSFRQTISEYSLDDDQKKAGTPIMGGILFIVTPLIVTLFTNIKAFADIDTLIVMLAFVGYGLIGFIDDYLIAVKKNNEGLSPKAKLIMQAVLAVIFFVLYQGHGRLEIVLPLSGKVLHLGFLYFFLVLFMFAGSSNAVNLTDGMDGLCAGVSIIALIPFLIISLGMSETLPPLIAGLIGALLGYLYYNKKPAKVFMGDTGALALGGILAAIAMVTKKEIALIVIAGIPVIETLSVILQVAAVKTIHRRIFPYTPIHYSFRLKGMPEKSVVYLFWMVEAVFALLGFLLATR